MKYIIFIGLVFILSACVTFRVVGDFPVYGRVVDKISQEPIADVEIVLKHVAVTFKSGSTTKTLAKVVTDSEGRFFIPENKTLIKGGTGGLAGYIADWPSLELRREGFCTRYSKMSDKESYQNMTIQLDRKDDNCL
ncbi:carboxypeptidase-like regulatory domain-containing protein [Pleionea sediminis]|uniref:carboxypeptidase-like regulatory domain-containing protein n=1 Tax=Pleionea sediminis TaxID=2569479 RepID=UPI0011860478|nr:carboxypeptidase-like regulatory domain-containing protein [Pleionea sediminis]